MACTFAGVIPTSTRSRVARLTGLDGCMGLSRAISPPVSTRTTATQATRHCRIVVFLFVRATHGIGGRGPTSGPQLELVEDGPEGALGRRPPPRLLPAAGRRQPAPRWPEPPPTRTRRAKSPSASRRGPGTFVKSVVPGRCPRTVSASLTSLAREAAVAQGVDRIVPTREPDLGRLRRPVHESRCRRDGERDGGTEQRGEGAVGPGGGAWPPLDSRNAARSMRRSLDRPHDPTPVQMIKKGPSRRPRRPGAIGFAPPTPLERRAGRAPFRYSFLSPSRRNGCWGEKLARQATLQW
jgi:hypothetical protein